MVVIKRRQVVIVSLVIMIAVAGYLNWSYKNDLDFIATTGDGNKEVSEHRIGEAEFVSDTGAENNSSIQEDEDKTVVSTASKNMYFTEARMEKERSRDEALEILQSVVDDEGSPKESKIKAQDEKIALAKIIDKEVIIENLIKAKGFKEVAVFMNEENINIVVQSNGLTPAQVAQIQEIVVTQSDVEADNIKLIEVK